MVEADVEHRELPVGEDGQTTHVYLFGAAADGGAGDFAKSAVYKTLEQTFHRLSPFHGNAGAGATVTSVGGSTQAPMGDGSMGSVGAAKLHIEQPLVDPVAYREVYRRDPTNRACVDVKVAYVCGQGWRLRPRNELFGNDQFSMAAPLTGEPDRGQLEVALKFLNACEPDYSLTELLMRVHTDVEAEGNGYIEVARDGDGKPTRMYYASAETMRILQDYTGFIQIRGRSKQFWARYGSGLKSVVLTKKSDDDPDSLDGMGVQFVGKTAKELLRERVASVGMRDVEGWAGKAKEGAQAATSVNEMMHFRVYTPRDTNYGEPCIISAIEDYLGGSNARLFMLTFFDRCTVPRLAVVVTGDELSDETVKSLKTWAESQDKLEAMNSTLVLQVPEGSQVNFEKLSSEQLKEGGFLEYRAMCDDAIKTAHRVPDSIIAVAGNSNRAESAEANTKFISGVVRPQQLPYMSKINYLLRNELGVTDWVFDLNVPDLTSEKVKAEIADLYLRRGAWKINDVRKSQGQAALDGGDEAFVLVPGAGVVFVKDFPTMESGSARKKVTAPQGQKTPEKGTDVAIRPPE